eukprot:GHVQ01031625.1.p1 GENE.GHVQ01031625.1~~GHVQ01031625.1.p1  ORF type:complete len:1215 (+),score=126.01 GHVQ01031625.1:338-3982(+)
MLQANKVFSQSKKTVRSDYTFSTKKKKPTACAISGQILRAMRHYDFISNQIAVHKKTSASPPSLYFHKNLHLPNPPSTISPEKGQKLLEPFGNFRRLSCAEFVTLVSTVAQPLRQNVRLWGHISRKCLELSPDFSAQEVAQVCHAFHRAGNGSAELWKSLAGHVVLRSDFMGGADIAKVLNAYSVNGRRDSRILAELSGKVVKKLSSERKGGRDQNLVHRDMSLAVGAYGRWKLNHEDLFTYVSHAIQEDIKKFLEAHHAFRPSVSETLFDLPDLENEGGEYYPAGDAIIPPKPRYLCRIMEAFAAVGCRDEPLFDLCLRHLLAVASVKPAVPYVYGYAAALRRSSKLRSSAPLSIVPETFVPFSSRSFQQDSVFRQTNRKKLRHEGNRSTVALKRRLCATLQNPPPDSVGSEMCSASPLSLRHHSNTTRCNSHGSYSPLHDNLQKSWTFRELTNMLRASTLLGFIVPKPLVMHWLGWLRSSLGDVDSAELLVISSLMPDLGVFNRFMIRRVENRLLRLYTKEMREATASVREGSGGNIICDVLNYTCKLCVHLTYWPSVQLRLYNFMKQWLNRTLGTTDLSVSDYATTLLNSPAFFGCLARYFPWHSPALLSVFCLHIDSLPPSSSSDILDILSHTQYIHQLYVMLPPAASDLSRHAADASLVSQTAVGDVPSLWMSILSRFADAGLSFDERCRLLTLLHGRIQFLYLQPPRNLCNNAPCSSSLDDSSEVGLSKDTKLSLHTNVLQQVWDSLKPPLSFASVEEAIHYLDCQLRPYCSSPLSNSAGFQSASSYTPQACGLLYETTPSGLAKLVEFFGEMVSLCNSRQLLECVEVCLSALLHESWSTRLHQVLHDVTGSLDSQADSSATRIKSFTEDSELRNSTKIADNFVESLENICRLGCIFLEQLHLKLHCFSSDQLAVVLVDGMSIRSSFKLGFKRGFRDGTMDNVRALDLTFSATLQLIQSIQGCLIHPILSLLGGQPYGEYSRTHHSAPINNPLHKETHAPPGVLDADCKETSLLAPGTIPAPMGGLSSLCSLYLFLKLLRHLPQGTGPFGISCLPQSTFLRQLAWAASSNHHAVYTHCAFLPHDACGTHDELASTDAGVLVPVSGAVPTRTNELSLQMYHEKKDLLACLLRICCSSYQQRSLHELSLFGAVMKYLSFRVALHWRQIEVTIKYLQQVEAHRKVDAECVVRLSDIPQQTEQCHVNWREFL